MKKHLILSIMAVLCLTGCNNGGAGSNAGADDDITLKTPKCLSMMSENCQAYVDDMRAQQQRLVQDNANADYYLNDLFGENGVDLTKGVAPCTGDSGTDGGYRDGTVQNDYLDDPAAEWEKGEKSDENKGVEISFEVSDSLKNKEYTIKYGVNQNLDGAKTMKVNKTTARLKNLFVNQQYYYQVSVDGKTSEVGSFKTGDYPRWIDARPMFNVRDAGGYTVKDGDNGLKRIKQGMVYRGGEITAAENWKSGQQYRGDTGGRYVNSSNMMQDGHIQTYAAASRYDDDRENNPARVAFREDMGMVGGVEIDLRSSGERNGYPANNNYCDFSSENDPDIGYVLKSISSYDNGMKNNKSLIKDVFEDYLSKADESPVYYHCYGGADRTGTIGFLLGAVLGMSYTDLVIDFELTSYSSNPSRNYRSHLRNGPYNYWPRMVNYLKNTLHWGSEKTIRESAEEFLVNDCNIKSETIAKIRQIMLEPIA